MLALLDNYVKVGLEICKLQNAKYALLNPANLFI